ncbi:hypothetical protein [Cloacibacillus porcorum]|uniref:hypothetical protein n=1 Tax=Cloacibacillus porcorum TaxID=1197717 RepID=UPI0026719BE0|nr:hypothetical protein [Cloacibacillus porcorum]
MPSKFYKARCNQLRLGSKYFMQNVQCCANCEHWDKSQTSVIEGEKYCACKIHSEKDEILISLVVWHKICLYYSGTAQIKNLRHKPMSKRSMKKYGF